MNFPRKQLRQRWVGRSVAAASLAIGLVAVPAAGASAASLQAFAYQVFDCSTKGTDFGVAEGTSAKPVGPIKDATIAANAVDADGTVVAPLKMEIRANVPDPNVRWATVEPDVEFDHVEFSVTIKGEKSTFKSPSVKPEVCDGPPGLSPDPAVRPGLTPVTPVRILDTRRLYPAVEAGKTVRVKVAGANGVPKGADTAMLNVTAAYPDAPGFLTVYPCNIARPKTSNINFVAGETRAGAVFTRIATNGDVCVYSSARTGVIVDLNGFIGDGGIPSALEPRRIVDTRPGAVTDIDGGPKGKQTALEIPYDKIGFIEGGDLVVNITTVGADAPGHISVGGCDNSDGGEVRTSVVNYVPGRAQANLAFVHVNSLPVCLSASAPTHIIVDLVGYFDRRSSLLPGPPLSGRLLDTRVGQKTSDGKFQGTGRLKANVPLKLKVRDRLYLEGATAAALNVTAVEESANGHITVYPCGDVAPVASNLNYTPDTAIANVALSALDADGNVCIVSYVDTDLVVDVAAFTSTTMFWEAADPLTGPDAWSWEPAANITLRGQVPETTSRQLWGGSGAYKITGPTVSGMSVQLGFFTGLGTTVDAYVMAKPVYTLVDSDGNSQKVTVDVMIDPQLYPSIFGVP